jgi:hypothetical protein
MMHLLVTCLSTIRHLAQWQPVAAAQLAAIGLAVKLVARAMGVQPRGRTA